MMTRTFRTFVTIIVVSPMLDVYGRFDHSDVIDRPNIADDEDLPASQTTV